MRQKSSATYKQVHLPQTQHHCDGRAAKRIATALFVDCVILTQLVETLMTAGHKCEACTKWLWYHETHLAWVKDHGSWHGR